MEAKREILTLEPIAGDPEVGRWLAAMQDARRDTLRELADLAADDLERTPEPGATSIGTLLDHIALVEADRLFVDILGHEGAPPWPRTLLPPRDRDADRRLTPITGVTLREHMDHLEAVRTLVLDHLGSMPVEEFHRPRRRGRRDVSPGWVLHHLLQHEAEHRAQIAMLRAARGSRSEAAVQIHVRPDGSYKVYGPVQVLDVDGRAFELASHRKLDAHGARIKLCRCGASATMPFCDDSHVDTGFQSVPRADGHGDPSSGSDV
jgi:CDGSH-type Zn-finger protein/uncharacterized damage-inducible protein DinB